eukprot:TRINITY_DN7460_c0_g1_i5.p1 TRINITY_DN7460_c0_g1~~TRINITY_DN7460_c0_g1_i5.p1  ORF type:complete len:101 (-),score=17.25 TRINITY_DN7460_c0_g1_i5:111-413(-)
MCIRDRYQRRVRGLIDAIGCSPQLGSSAASRYRAPDGPQDRPRSPRRRCPGSCRPRQHRVSIRRSRTAVSYTHLRAHETPEHLVCRLLLEKKKKKLTRQT